MFQKKSNYSYEELILCGEGKLFDSGLPKLPKPPMLMFDRISEINSDGGSFEKGLVKAEYDIKPELWFFDCHFENDPVMPGCLGVDAVWQLLGFFLGWSGHSGKGRALGCDEVKFKGEVLPKAKKVEYVLDIKKMLNRKLILGVADSKVFVDDEEIYSMKNLKVGLYN